MSGSRRHVGRPITQRLARQFERQASSAEAARRDLIARHAIMRRTDNGAAVWWCVQSNGHPKPGYRSEQVALRVAATLAELGNGKSLVAYLCSRRGRDAIAGEHWHLATARPRKVLTPPDEGRIVSVVGESDTEESST